MRESKRENKQGLIELDFTGSTGFSSSGTEFFFVVVVVF